MIMKIPIRHNNTGGTCDDKVHITLKNASFPIFETDDGILIETIDVVFSKASSPISSIPSWSIAFVRLLHL